MRRYPQRVAVEIERDSFIVRIDGDVAWVEFDQTNQTADNCRRDRTSREQRLMIRSDGQWRLAVQVTSGVRSFERDRAGVEWDFNTLGYNFLEAGAVQEAIKILELNVQLFPESWNVYDSLGEALAAAGQVELAIRKVRKINAPQSREPMGSCSARETAFATLSTFASLRARNQSRNSGGAVRLMLIRESHLYQQSAF